MRQAPGHQTRKRDLRDLEEKIKLRFRVSFQQLTVAGFSVVLQDRRLILKSDFERSRFIVYRADPSSIKYCFSAFERFRDVKFLCASRLEVFSDLDLAIDRLRDLIYGSG
ncbi:MAG: hypothetical protein F4039_07340 [Gammaproteobacteria bacterium]|nr:hypothetical protein [Gammaproteobacteria bacterium]MYK43883.1 hypothetical protein [Gammaproteobacteria bacterium]